MRLTPFEVAQHSFANPVVRRKERKKMAIAQSLTQSLVAERASSCSLLIVVVVKALEKPEGEAL